MTRKYLPRGFWETVWSEYKRTRWRHWRDLALIWEIQWIAIGTYCMYRDIVTGRYYDWRHWAVSGVIWLLVWLGCWAYEYCGKRVKEAQE